jgi:adenylate cyclase
VLEERQAKEEMRRTFSAYVAPGIIDSIYDDPDKLQLGGAKKDVSILFTDIRSFTTMTENMDSEILVAQLNEYFEQMVDAIMSHQGTLHKFIGDAIMAVWGDIKYAGPTLDAGQALSAALAMRHRLSQLNRQWTGESRPEFRMGMGINYGQVVVGNIGAPQRMEFTVIGDAVNLAARLESLNKQFGTEILVGESIYDLAHERFNFRFAGKVQVKGKGTGVSIYEVLCEKGSENESPYDLKWVQLYEEAFTRFNERRYDVATRLFEACLNDYPDDTLSSMWLDYSRYFIETPPPEDWDGTIEMTSK